MSKKMTASEQLAEHRQRISQAEQRVSECELALSSARHRAESADEGLASHVEDTEAAERTLDPADLKRLAAEAKAKREQAEVETIRARAAVRGAGRALDARRNDEQQFAAEHRPELTAELGERAQSARDRLLEAVEDLRAAGGEWGSTRREWERLLTRWQMTPAELPPVPLGGAWGEIDRALAPLESGVRRDPRRLVPMPVSLVPGDWSAFESTGDSDGD